MKLSDKKIYQLRLENLLYRIQEEVRELQLFLACHTHLNYILQRCIENSLITIKEAGDEYQELKNQYSVRLQELEKRTDRILRNLYALSSRETFPSSRTYGPLDLSLC